MASQDVLSKDEVDSLLEDDKRTDQYEFTEPLISHIEHGQMFKILDTLLIDELTNVFTKFLHLPVQVKDNGVEISRYDKIVAQIRNKPRTYHDVQLLPDQEHLLLTLSQPFIYKAIELLFGATPNAKAIPEKNFAHVEIRVAEKLVDEIVESLRKSWESIAHKELNVKYTSHHPMRIPLCTSGEKVVMMKYEVTLRESVSDFIICFPIKLFDFKTQKDSDIENLNNPEVKAWFSTLKNNVLNSSINLTGVLSSVDVKFNKVSNLKVGDVIPIPTPKDGKLYAEDVLIFKGVCGTSDEHNVMKLTQCMLDH